MKVKLPNNVIEFLVDLPEHGMGYQKIRLGLKDGKEIETTVQNSQWVNLPDGVLIADVKSIEYIWD